ncbi:MAG: PRTRC system protein E [bacterium]|nr:PRTRC system protein E [bacterium]
MALFTLLADCLGPDEKLHFELRRDGAGLTVLVLPHLRAGPEAGDPALRAAREALAAPLVLRGTAASLDGDLPGALAGYAAARGALAGAAADLAALERALGEARDAAGEKRGRLARAGAGGAAAPASAPPPPAPASAAEPAGNPDSLF